MLMPARGVALPCLEFLGHRVRSLRRLSFFRHHNISMLFVLFYESSVPLPIYHESVTVCLYVCPALPSSIQVPLQVQVSPFLVVVLFVFLVDHDEKG